MKPRTQQVVRALHTCRVLGHRRGYGLPQGWAPPAHCLPAASWQSLEGITKLGIYFHKSTQVYVQRKCKPYTEIWQEGVKKKKSLCRASCQLWGSWSLLECNYFRQLPDSYIQETAVLFWKQAQGSTCLAKRSISSDKQFIFTCKFGNSLALNLCKTTLHGEHTQCSSFYYS